MALLGHHNPVCPDKVSPRADGAKRRARVLIPPGYLHPGKGSQRTSEV
jgi:hypothetical protein